MPTVREPRLTAVQDAIDSFATGGLVVVSDGEDRENEADLVMAAQFATAESVGFIVRHTGGIVCVPMCASRAGSLDLSAMVDANTDLHKTAFTVSVDHVSASTGISAKDRAATIQALADTQVEAASFRRPGHVFPLVARAGGVLKRAGHTEAAVDLARLAGTREVGVISELVTDTGEPMRPDEARRFSMTHGLPYLTIEDLQRFRRTNESLIDRGGTASLPTERAVFQAQAYRSRLDGTEHLALTLGEVAWCDDKRPVLVRVHSECLTGDVLGSQRCDCGSQLALSMQLIADAGRGVIVYLRGQEGRGIGLSHKLEAYALQELGRDTVDANLDLGLPIDSRDYGIGAQILADLGVRRIRLLTNNPAKYTGLAGYDLEISERVPLRAAPLPSNVNYMATKQRRLGHDLGLPLGG
jgi:3,4-dihydroxy 2-butanone 4-phosphate synthase/GTP cyclohydrolase II